MITHEAYIANVAAIAASRLDREDAAKLAGIKLTYGKGPGGVRGVTYYNAWSNGDESHAFCEICASGESSELQVAGTTIHELAHVVAGWNAGHGPAWKAACKRLGLRRAIAAGQEYSLAAFAPDVRHAVAKLDKPTDGQPVAALSGKTQKPCTAGIGTRGGKSRGVGSGSRMLKVSCPNDGYTVRATAKWLELGAPKCGICGEDMH